MNKSIIVMLLILGFYLLVGNISANKITIPDDAIRLRVVPNSNTQYDQSIKKKVSHLLQSKMYHLLENTKGIEDARDTINNNLNDIDNSISDLLIKEQYNLGYKVNFGYNYFPEKEFNDVIYDEGYYESVLVTLGKGEGDNWWCVLFPPLCLLEASEGDKVEYKFFIQEMLEKYL